MLHMKALSNLIKRWHTRANGRITSGVVEENKFGKTAPTIKAIGLIMQPTASEGT